MPGAAVTAAAVEREVELEHVHARLAEEAERAPLGVRVDEPEHVRPCEAPFAGDAGRLQPRVRGARCAGRGPSPRR